MINICSKYGFDSLIISGSYGGHRQHTTDKSQGYGISSSPDELKRYELDVTIKDSILGVGCSIS